jgi:hypothetical protein
LILGQKPTQSPPGSLQAQLRPRADFLYLVSIFAELCVLLNPPLTFFFFLFF